MRYFYQENALDNQQSSIHQTWREFWMRLSSTDGSRMEAMR